ncbi:hypothetical protein Tco_0358100 [Tanacetum coccineum]
MVEPEQVKVEQYICGLSKNICGDVTSSRPGMKRIFKKRSKRKAKNKQIQAQDGKDQVKSKSKVIRMKKIQLEGLKLPSLKLYYKRLKRQGAKLPTG